MNLVNLHCVCVYVVYVCERVCFRHTVCVYVAMSVSVCSDIRPHNVCGILVR